MMENKSHIYEIVIVGPSCVGKTSICTRYFHKNFEILPQTTVGIDPYQKTIETTDDCTFILRFLDIGGAERFQRVAKPFIQKAQVMIYVFSFDNLDSFTSLHEWIKNVDIKYKILVGNKCDLEKLVTSSQILEICQEYDLKYFETSAKTGENVDDLFGYITEVLVDDIEKQEDLEPLIYNWDNDTNKFCFCW